MKKIFISFLCLIIAAGFAACGDSDIGHTAEANTDVLSEKTVNASENVQENTEKDMSVSKSDIADKLGYAADENFNEQLSAASIAIKINDTTLYADLYDTDLAKEFAKLLPQTLTMQRVGGGREFYGSLTGSLDYDEADSQTAFENGEIAYWYSGNGLCLLYNNQVDEPEVKSGIIILGKITSDYSVLFDLENQIEAEVTLNE